MKKLILSIIFTFAFSVFVPVVSADWTISIPSTIYLNTPYTPVCGSNIAIYKVYDAGMNQYQFNCGESFSINPATMTVGGQFGIRGGDAGWNGYSSLINFTPIEAPAPVLGCMDSTATNYNASATQSDSSCIYPPSAPTFVGGYTNGYIGTPPPSLDKTATKDLVVNKLGLFGNALLVILGIFLGIGVAYLIFRVGWRKLIDSLDGGYASSKAGYSDFSGDNFAEYKSGYKRGVFKNYADYLNG